MIHLFEKDRLFRLPADTKAKTKVKGQGDKGLLVIAYLEDLSEDNQSKLGQILNAIKHDPSTDIKMIGIQDRGEISLSEVVRTHDAKAALIFGMSPTQVCLNITINKYEWAHLEGLSVLFSDSIEQMKADKLMKNQLWQSLKSQFLQ